MDKILCVGGSGFIGKHLVRKLSKLGTDVHVMDISHSVPDLGTFHRGDVTKFEECIRIMGRTSPDYVFYLAAQPVVDIARDSPFDTLETNIRGAYNFLHAVRDVGRHVKGIVWVSTDKVYGDHSDDVSEHSDLRGDDHPYNASKLCGDVIARMYAKCYGLPIVIVRNGNIYGPGDIHWNRIVPGTIRRVMHGESPVLRMNGFRDYIHVDDIVNGYLHSMMGLLDGTVKYGDVVNFGSPKGVYASDVISLILSKMGRKDLKVTQITSKNEIPYQHIDFEYARNVLGWVPEISFNVGLDRTISWYKENIQ
jgi:CDP-glucose 4,6-dehydratase